MAIRIVRPAGWRKFSWMEALPEPIPAAAFLQMSNILSSLPLLAFPDSPQHGLLHKLGVESDISDHLDPLPGGECTGALPTYPQYDNGYLRTEPGLYPDPLFPLKDRKVKVLAESGMLSGCGQREKSLPESTR